MRYQDFRLEISQAIHCFRIQFHQLNSFIMARTNLDERLINFAVEVLKIAEKMDKSYAGSHLSSQLIRSSTSAAQNYGEAQSGESRKDFIHKLKIVLKELRETIIGLKIVQRAKLYSITDHLESTVSENNELISIFVTSIETATKNMATENPKSTNIKLK